MNTRSPFIKDVDIKKSLKNTIHVPRKNLQTKKENCEVQNLHPDSLFDFHLSEMLGGQVLVASAGVSEKYPMGKSEAILFREDHRSGWKIGSDVLPLQKEMSQKFRFLGDLGFSLRLKFSDCFFLV